MRRKPRRRHSLRLTFPDLTFPPPLSPLHPSPEPSSRPACKLTPFSSDAPPARPSYAECFYYRGLNCTIEGHRLHLPYLCPTDHVLWGGGKGLKVPFLEPGFMVRRAITDNPDTHTRVDVRGGARRVSEISARRAWLGVAVGGEAI